MSRRWVVVAVLAVAVVISASPGSALQAGQPGIDDLVISTLEGFESNALGIDGEVDASTLARLAGIDEDEVAGYGDEFLGFFRSFRSLDGARNGFIFAIVTDGNAGREGAARGAERAIRRAGYRPLDTPFTSEAVVTYQGTLPVEGPPVASAVAAYGSTEAAYIIIATDQDPVTTLQQVLGPQLALAPAVEPEEREEDSAAFQFGYRFGNWLLIGGGAYLVWYLSQRRTRSAARAAGPSGATRERLKTTTAQWEPFRRVQASSEASTAMILERRAVLDDQEPVPLAIRDHLDRHLSVVPPAADPVWLRLAVTEGWRLGRAALRLEDDAYPYEQADAVLPAEQATLLDEAVERLVSSNLSRSITGHLRDSVVSTAQSLARHQPVGGRQLSRQELASLVWRGVATALAEFEVLHRWTPPARVITAAPRPQRRVLRAPNRQQPSPD